MSLEQEQRTLDRKQRKMTDLQKKLASQQSKLAAAEGKANAAQIAAAKTRSESIRSSKLRSCQSFCATKNARRRKSQNCTRKSP